MKGIGDQRRGQNRIITRDRGKDYFRAAFGNLPRGKPLMSFLTVMSTFEPTVIVTILQNAERMTPKQAKEFHTAWGEKVCEYCCHVENMRLPHCSDCRCGSGAKPGSTAGRNVNNPPTCHSLSGRLTL